jgi:uncharacterized coiled-coil protein SlyX
LLDQAPACFNAKENETAPHFMVICYGSGMEERIIKLESLLTLQDQTISTLNEELYRQQQDMARMKRSIEALENKLQELGNNEQVAGQERPPHY